MEIAVEDTLLVMGRESVIDNKLYGGLSPSSSSSGGYAPYCMCDCGLKLVVLTSITKKNPRRKFMRYPKYRSRVERCDFFEWVDCEICEKKEI